MIKRIGKLVVFAFLLVAIVSLSKNIINLAQKGATVQQEKQKLTGLKKENQQLKARLDYIKTEQFLEQEARNSLGLSKGEVVIVLPPDFYKESLVGAKKATPTWKQWWELLSGRGRI